MINRESIVVADSETNTDLLHLIDLDNRIGQRAKRERDPRQVTAFCKSLEKGIGIPPIILVPVVQNGKVAPGCKFVIPDGVTRCDAVVKNKEQGMNYHLDGDIWPYPYSDDGRIDLSDSVHVKNLAEMYHNLQQGKSSSTEDLVSNCAHKLGGDNVFRKAKEFLYDVLKYHEIRYVDISTVLRMLYSLSKGAVARNSMLMKYTGNRLVEYLEEKYHYNVPPGISRDTYLAKVFNKLEDSIDEIVELVPPGGSPIDPVKKGGRMYEGIFWWRYLLHEYGHNKEKVDRAIKITDFTPCDRTNFRWRALKSERRPFVAMACIEAHYNALANNRSKIYLITKENVVSTDPFEYDPEKEDRFLTSI